MRDAGTQHLFAGRLREAIVDLSRAVISRPTHAAHHNLAVALRSRGDIATALEHARIASALAPSCAPTLALVGSLQHLAGDLADALATFRAALVVDPTHDVSRYYLAIALANTGARDAAIAELRSVTRVPESVRARIQLQIADLLANDVSPATAASATASTKHPADQADLCSIPLVTEIVATASNDDVAKIAATASNDIAAEDRARARRGRTAPLRAGHEVDLDEARALLDRATRIVALTGAGISSASGLATRKELWRKHDRDSAVSIAQFHRDPMPLWTVIADFLGDRVLEPNVPHRALEPNAAHRALAAMTRLVGIVTQNVEGLHQAAGALCPVIELHGTLLETRCDTCGARPGLSCADALADNRGAIPPRCECGAALRPDVVLFGEWVDRARLQLAAELVASCDLLLVVGTAADVAPAADLPLLAISRGATVIEIKRHASRLVRAGALHLAGVAEDLLPQLARARSS